MILLISLLVSCGGDSARSLEGTWESPERLLEIGRDVAPGVEGTGYVLSVAEGGLDPVAKQAGKLTVIGDELLYDVTASFDGPCEIYARYAADLVHDERDVLVLDDRTYERVDAPTLPERSFGQPYRRAHAMEDDEGRGWQVYGNVSRFEVYPPAHSIHRGRPVSSFLLDLANDMRVHEGRMVHVRSDRAQVSDITGPAWGVCSREPLTLTPRWERDDCYGAQPVGGRVAAICDGALALLEPDDGTTVQTLDVAPDGLSTTGELLYGFAFGSGNAQRAFVLDDEGTWLVDVTGPNARFYDVAPMADGTVTVVTAGEASTTPYRIANLGPDGAENWQIPVSEAAGTYNGGLHVEPVEGGVIVGFVGSGEDLGLGPITGPALVYVDDCGQAVAQHVYAAAGSPTMDLRTLPSGELYLGFTTANEVTVGGFTITSAGPQGFAVAPPEPSGCGG